MLAGGQGDTTGTSESGLPTASVGVSVSGHAAQPLGSIRTGSAFLPIAPAGMSKGRGFKSMCIEWSARHDDTKR